jgi:GH25 family lysozyme M1 (1,4-beta-N-acetylmuramidase)
MTRGVDIYRYQTVTDWRALATSVSWAYVKLTDGTGPAIVRGDKQVNGCKSVGIPVGGYHYAQPGDPGRQAKVFLAEVARLGADDLAPALDLEAPFQPNVTARDFGIGFCRAVAEAGHRPAVYMSASWAGSLRPERWGIPGLVIWIAAYGGNDGGPYGSDDPGKVSRYYGGRYDLHQHSSTATVPGISGRVDLNWALTGVPRNSKEVTDVALSDETFEFTAPDGRKLTVKAIDALANLYIERFYGSKTDPWTGPSGRAIDLGEAAETLNVELDEVLLADELAKRGVGGATPEQVREALEAVFRRGGTPEGE